MGKCYQGRGGGGRGRGGLRASTNQKGSRGESAPTANYRAPTVGYKDQFFSHGTTKAAATFTAVLTKLARMVSLQSWAGAKIAGRAMEKLEEPTLIGPKQRPWSTQKRKSSPKPSWARIMNRIHSSRRLVTRWLQKMRP